MLNEIKELKFQQQKIPSPNVAYAEATSLGEISPLDFNWSHPFVYHAGAKVGWYRLKTESEFEIKSDFIDAYEEILEKAGIILDDQTSKATKKIESKVKSKPIKKEPVKSSESDLRRLSEKTLNKKLNLALEKEDYELYNYFNF